MEKTTLISANKTPYEREVPRVIICGNWNDVALEHLRENTGIDFQMRRSGSIEGQPETWEQFSKIFLTYNFLTHSINNWNGNYMILRSNLNVPQFAKLYYEQDGKKFIGVE